MSIFHTMRLYTAMKNSLRGVFLAWRHETAFRQESILCCVFIPCAFFIGRDVVEIILLVGSCILILMVELINSAIEATVDRIGSEQHELSGKAKDMASAAVLCSLVFFVIIWISIIWSHF